MVQGAISDGAYDIRRAYHVPGDAGRVAVLEQRVFLRVVEVCFEVDSGIGFEGGIRCWADVEAVVLCACLEEEALWFEAGLL